MNSMDRPPNSPRETPLGSNREADEVIRLDAPTTQVPGGFWRRVVASVVDGAIYSIVTLPFSLAIGFVIRFLSGSSEGVPQDNTGVVILLNLLSYVITLVVMFFYFGWFHKHKGATPGKMLMRLRIAYADTGTNLNYGRTFAREVIGKSISSVVLLIGFLMVAFRQDKRGLHDLMFNTQVTYEPK